MKTAHTAAFLCAAICCGLWVPAVWAQQRPEVGYIDPPGGQAGTTLDVRLGGYDFTPDTQFFVLDERIQLEVLGPPGDMLHPGPPHLFGPRALNSNKPFPVPREVPARLTIPADMPAGPIGWQAANANGASAVGQFIVSRDLQEVHEDNAASPSLQKLPPSPFILSGRLRRREEVDRFQFTADKTGPVTCMLEAGQAGSGLHSVFKIHDSSGRRIADAADPLGRGLQLTFPAQTGEIYTFMLHDLDYRGDWSLAYRLRVEQAPHVVAAIPAAVRRGTSQQITFWGFGIATGGTQLESVTATVDVPDSASTHFPFRLETPHGTAPPFDLLLSRFVEAAEPERENDEPLRLEIPSGVTGTLDARFRHDDYAFHASKGQVLRIAADAERIGSPLDMALTIFDAGGKSVATCDDLTDTTDAEIRFTAPDDGIYRIQVGDVSGNGGTPAAVYRVSITSPQPRFKLSVPARAETVIGADQVAPPKRPPRRKTDQPGLLTIEAQRHDGFDGAIHLRITGLPDGVSVSDETLTIPPKETSFSIPIPCAADAASFAAIATVSAWGELEDGNRFEDRANVLIAPVMTPRAVVRPKYPDAGRTVHRGATYPAPVVLERLEGYEGEVELQMAAHPDRVRQGIRGDAIIVPPGIEQTDFPLFLPEWVETDRTSRIVLNTVVRVPDPQGNVRHLVNRMDKRITMNVEGALLKVTAMADEIPIRGETVEVPVKLLRSPKLSGPVEVSLSSGDGRNDGFRAQPIVVSADREDALLTITAASGGPSPGEHTLVIEARGMRAGQPVISWTEVFLQRK